RGACFSEPAEALHIKQVPEMNENIRLNGFHLLHRPFTVVRIMDRAVSAGDSSPTTMGHATFPYTTSILFGQHRVAPRRRSKHVSNRTQSRQYHTHLGALPCLCGSGLPQVPVLTPCRPADAFVRPGRYLTG